MGPYRRRTGLRASRWSFEKEEMNPDRDGMGHEGKARAYPLTGTEPRRARDDAAIGRRLGSMGRRGASPAERHVCHRQKANLNRRRLSVDPEEMNGDPKEMSVD